MILEKVYDELYGMIEDLKKKVQAAEKTDVTIAPALESGTKLADFEIDGTEGTIYGPITPVYVEDVIYDEAAGSGSAAGPQTVTINLTHPFSDYDFLYFIAAAFTGDAPADSSYVATALSKTSITDTICRCAAWGAYGTREIELSAAPDATSTTLVTRCESNVKLYVYKIVGIKISNPVTTTRTKKKK